MDSMQTRLTGRFAALAEADLGLEVGDSRGNGSNLGTWYVHGGPDGLDVPLTVAYDFQRDNARFTLAGPAVDNALAWLRKNLPTGWVAGSDHPRSDRRVLVRAEYADPAQVRLFFTTARYLLTPYKRPVAKAAS